MELLDQATLVGLKAYMWSEEIAYNNVPTNQALFVVCRAEDKFVRGVLPFRVDDIMLYGWDGRPIHFGTRHQGPALISMLSSLQLFNDRLVMELAREIELLLYSSFRFTPYPADTPRTPRLVVVADLSFTEAESMQPLAPPPEENAGMGTQQAEHSDDDSYMGFDYMNDFDDDVDDTYSDEMIEIIAELRLLYYPAMNPSEPPRVLTEQRLNLEIGLYEEAEQPSECAICFETLAAGKIVLRTGCGHVFHKTCSIRWFSTAFTCPMCRAETLIVF